MFIDPGYIASMTPGRRIQTLVSVCVDDELFRILGVHGKPEAVSARE
jgi:hypothetical protein